MIVNCSTADNGVKHPVSACDLTLRVGGRVLVRGISFELIQGGVLRVSGPNGSGKTTLLRTLIPVSPGPSGLVYGAPLQLGRTLGYLPQNAHETLLPWLNGRENVLVGLARAADIRLSANFAALTCFFLGDGSKHSDPVDVLESYKRGVDVLSLSGGERQKLAILRAVVCSPRVLLLDEPFAELDGSAVGALVDYIKAFTRAAGSVVLVTHQEVALSYCGEVKL